MPTTITAARPSWTRQPVPPIPIVDESNADLASTTYSHYRTGLSNHRTDLSEHRTELSTDRTAMSKRRTGMSFQRTRMSADRTLMSVIRTSLSLISFGFTIAQVFQKLHDAGAVAGSASPRNFGIALIAIGIAMLVGGIGYHLAFMIALRHERLAMVEEDLLYGQSPFPPSLTLMTAILLLALALLVIAGMALRLGPFG